MRRSTLILGVLLGASVIFNLVAIGRLRDRETGRTPARTVSGPASESSGAPEEKTTADPGPVRREASTTDGGASKPKNSAKQPVTLPSMRNDPKVQEVLDAQDSFSAFWKELDRLFKARDKFDETKYSETVLTATGDFLELGDTARSLFVQSAQGSVVLMADARKQYDAERQALPPKDKSDAAGYAEYKRQKDAIDARYKDRVKSAVDGLRTALDPQRPRHLEFLAHADRWLRNLAPRPAK